MSDVDRPVLNSISLFSGVGMLDVGIASGLEYLGCGHRTVAYVEREAFACSQLVALMQAGCLGEAPVWSDVTTFPAGKFRGLVDIIVGGFPCQDLSVAGRRAGLDGKRSGLFFTILDIADACDAPVLFLENVSAIATANATVVDEAEGELIERAAARVMGELADRGWDAEWLHLRASDVGASHQRERWFCLAIRRDRMDDAVHGRHRSAKEEIRAGRHGAVDASGGAMADAERAERWPDDEPRGCAEQGIDGQGQATGRVGESSDASVGNAGCALSSRARRIPQSAVELNANRAASGLMAHPSSTGPQRNELSGTRISHRGGRKHMDQLSNFVAYSPQAQAIQGGQESSSDSPTSRPRLNPAFAAWLMGLPPLWTNPAVTSSEQLAMVVYRSNLQSHLFNLCADSQMDKAA